MQEQTPIDIRKNTKVARTESLDPYLHIRHLMSTIFAWPWWITKHTKLCVPSGPRGADENVEMFHLEPRLFPLCPRPTT